MPDPCGTAPWPEGYPEFHPRPWLANGHLQTIFGNFLPRPDHLPAPTRQLITVAPAHGSQIASQVLCECHWQPLPDRSSRPTAIIVHGLEGSSRSQYVIGNANKLWRAGCNVVRMNMRNCGGRDYEMARLTPTLYHSGLSTDVDRVMRFFIETEGLASISLIGYSMGGNLVLKLAGDLALTAPPELRSVIAVSPAADLAASADALHEWQNRLYERKFLRALLKRFRRKTVLFPRAFDPQRAAAARVLHSIAVPTLLLHACDDPFIRFNAETRATIAANPHITLLETEHGGHCAFVAPRDRTNGYDGYWAEHTAMRFLLAHS